MVYKDNIPQPQNLLSESQVDILENFSQLNIVYGTDHVAYNAPADVGKHKTVTYVAQTANPTTVAGEAKEFSRVFNTAAANPLDVLHFTRGSSNAVPTPLTSFQNSTVIPSITAGAANALEVLNLTGVNEFFATTYVNYGTAGSSFEGYLNKIRYVSPGTLVDKNIDSGNRNFEWSLNGAGNLQLEATQNITNVNYSIQFIRIS